MKIDASRLRQLIGFAILAVISYAVYERYHSDEQGYQYEPFTKGYSIEGVLSPNRALTYDPFEDVFYTGNITAPIVVVDREGNEIRRYDDHSMIVYGLAWFKHDVDGYPLYLFCQAGTDTRLKVKKLNPSTGDVQEVVDLVGSAGDLAGGAVVTANWDPTMYAFVGQIMGSSLDKIGVWELAPNTDVSKVVLMANILSNPAGTG